MKRLLQLCPYTHVFEALRRRKHAAQNAKLVRSGGIIALLGLFCPLFWVPFLTGTPLSALWFDIIHSSIFICVGLGMMLYGTFVPPKTR